MTVGSLRLADVPVVRAAPAGFPVGHETRQDKTIKFTLSREIGSWKIDSFEQQ